MHTPSGILARATVTAATLALLTGCTSTAAPTQSAATETSISASAPTPTASAAVAEPALVNAPQSAVAAIEAANQSVLGYYQAAFVSWHSGGQQLAHVTPWVTGSALKSEQLLATYLRKKHLRLDGAPTGWTVSSSKSSASEAVDVSGQRIPYGSVRLVGCEESTNYPVGPGAPRWTSKGKQYPTQWTVLYNSDRKQWIVSQSIALSATAGTPSCS